MQFSNKMQKMPNQMIHNALGTGLPIAAEFGKNGLFLTNFFPLPIFAEIADFADFRN